MDARDSDWLIQGAQTFGIRLRQGQIAQFNHFAIMLEEWNSRLNLTRIPPADYVTLHFLDSLAAAAAHNFAESDSFIDVGTGAGFPGIPLKIAFPHLRVMLLDSTRKRLAFLDEVIRKLGLSDCSTLHARAEHAARNPTHRQRYGCAAARAVARMDTLAEWLLPFVRVGGVALALKSGAVDEEVAESVKSVTILGGYRPETIPVAIPGAEVDRKIVRIRKSKPTPPKYPRDPSHNL